MYTRQPKATAAMIGTATKPQKWSGTKTTVEKSQLRTHETRNVLLVIKLFVEVFPFIGNLLDVSVFHLTDKKQELKSTDCNSQSRGVIG